MPNINTYKYSSIFGISLVLLLFGSPNLLLAVQHFIERDYYTLILDIFHFLVTSGLFLLPMVLFKWRIRRYLLIIAPVFTIVPIIVFIVAIYHKMPTRSIIFTLFEAHKIEVLEFISDIYFWKLLLILFPLIVVLTSIRIIHPEKRISKKFRVFFIGFYSALFLLTFCFKTLQRKTLNKTLKASYRTYFRNSPVNGSLRFYRALKAYKTDKKDNYNNRSLCIYQRPEINSREVYILVLGESSRYNNWGLNGYKRNTSPNIIQINNIVNYQNIISPSFSTNKSIPIILTTKSTKNYYDTENYTSVINLFKKAGFTTYWLGNQPIKGTEIGQIAATSHELYESDYRKRAVFDGELLSRVDTILNRNEQKTFIIIHIWGSHYPYQNRYPESFKFFTPTIKGNQHIPLYNGHKNEIINSYDNSILYTDFILSRLINLINIDSAISSLTFLSDHGENLFDDKNIGFGRGFGKYSPQLFHIPLFFWASDHYITSNQVKWETLIENNALKSTTEGIIYTFSDLAGIYWDKFDSTQSFANKSYREKERFFIDKNKLFNYDKFFSTNRKE